MSKITLDQEQVDRLIQILNILHKQTDLSRVQMEDAIVSIAKRFSIIAETIGKNNPEDRERLTQEMQDVIFSLQFQDRVAQVLHHSADAIEGLQERLERSHNNDTNEGTDPLDLASLLQEMEKSCTTYEQTMIHRGEDIACNASHEIELF